MRYFERWCGLVREGMLHSQSMLTSRIAFGAKICQGLFRAVAQRRKAVAMELWKYQLMTRWVKEKAMLLPLNHSSGTNLSSYTLPWPGL